MLDSGRSDGDFSGNKILPASWRLMVEQDPIAGKDVVRFSVVRDNPVSVKLGDAIRASRVERRCLILWDCLHFPEQLARGSLIEFCFEARFSQGVEKTESYYGIDLRSILRDVERNLNMTLCREIVYLIGLNLLQKPVEITGVRQVPIVQEESLVHQILVFDIQMVNSPPVERTAASKDSVDLISLFKKNLSKI